MVLTGVVANVAEERLDGEKRVELERAFARMKLAHTFVAIAHIALFATHSCDVARLSVAVVADIAEQFAHCWRCKKSVIKFEIKIFY